MDILTNIWNFIIGLGIVLSVLIGLSLVWVIIANIIGWFIWQILRFIGFCVSVQAEEYVIWSRPHIIQKISKKNNRVISSKQFATKIEADNYLKSLKNTYPDLFDDYRYTVTILSEYKEHIVERISKDNNKNVVSKKFKTKYEAENFIQSLKINSPDLFDIFDFKIVQAK